MKIQFGNGAIDAHRLAQWCGGSLLNDQNGSLLVTGMCTDSREADGSTVFCALRGERTDGHNYIEAALSLGCKCVLCECLEGDLPPSVAVILVEDTQRALAKFANAYRRTLACKAVAVTGSVGKTTTKEMIAAVLSEAFVTYRTAGNHNSLVGMPLSVGEISSDVEWAVLEMGMSGFGEIERLSAAAEPDMAVITNIGTAHMELLGSRKNICRAKLEILSGLRPGGTLILNGDEPLLRRVRGKSYKTVYVSLEGEKSDFSAKNIRVERDCTVFDLITEQGTVSDLRINVLGRHNVYAALFAIAIGTRIGMTEEQLRRGLLRFHTDGIRQSMTQCGDWTFFEDCYNASPESMMASLEVLRQYSSQTGRRSVAVLGDMLELGSESCAMHQRVGAQLASMGIDSLITLGSFGRQIADGARRAGMTAIFSMDNPAPAERRDAARQILDRLCPHDVVLFKASRGVGEEHLIAALKNLKEAEGEERT